MRRILRRFFSYVLFTVGLPFFLGHPKLRAGLGVRLGYYRRPDRRLPPHGGPRVWLHGASAGDVLALKPLGSELKQQCPAMHLTVSTITNSGRVMAERHQHLFDEITYLPYDLPGAVRRALARHAPDVLVLEYTELWPELIDAVRRRAGTKLVLHNGRFSGSRLNRYRWLFALSGNLLHAFDAMLMRDAHEVDRALALGADEHKVHATGNTKFDNLVVSTDSEKTAELQQAWQLPEATERIWVAGSTHEGEEEIILDTFLALRATYPDLYLLIAPRYVERSSRILALAEKRKLTARLRSRRGGPVDILILDTIGELSSAYALAQIVFVGGSFVPRGGQNILEPAACGKPVLFGPNMENFTDSLQVLLGRGGIQVASKDLLRRVLLDLLGQPAHCAELGSMAQAQVFKVRGAAARNARIILQLCDDASLKTA